jgi:acetolactate synthase-1/2/3 large subunit
MNPADTALARTGAQLLVDALKVHGADFAALPRAYGLHGEIVEETSQFEAAFKRVQAAKTAALIEVRIDPDAISPRATLSGIRAEAIKGKA